MCAGLLSNKENMKGRNDNTAECKLILYIMFGKEIYIFFTFHTAVK